MAVVVVVLSSVSSGVSAVYRLACTGLTSCMKQVLVYISVFNVSESEPLYFRSSLLHLYSL